MDTRCSLEDLPRAMDNRDGCCESVTGIHTSCITIYYDYLYFLGKCVCVCVFHYVKGFKERSRETQLKCYE